MHPISRRTFIQSASLAGAVLVSNAGIAAVSPMPRRLVLVWLDGGPSPFETFCPTENGSVGRIRCPGSDAVISEWLPQMAKQMRHISLLAAVTHSEGIHDRARRLVTHHPDGACRLSEIEGGGRVHRVNDNLSFAEQCRRVVPDLMRGEQLVQINMRGWDTHCDNHSRIKESLAPTLDNNLSRLITDLRATGLWEETRFVCMGEFGRSPQLNVMGGRDHWPQAGFALIGGQGIPGGVVHGRLDRWGEPADGGVEIGSVLSWTGKDKYS